MPGFKILLIGFAFWLDTRCFDWGDIRSKFTSRSLLYLALLACFVYMAERIQVLRERYVGRPKQRRMYLVIGICVCGLLYYLVVVTFAYSIYPAIPAGRGGGDLSESAAIRVSCDAHSAVAVPPSLIEATKDGRLTTIPLVAIQENAESILVASFTEYCKWHEERLGGTRTPRVPQTFRILFGRSNMCVIVKDTDLCVGGRRSHEAVSRR